MYIEYVHIPESICVFCGRIRTSCGLSNGLIKLLDLIAYLTSVQYQFKRYTEQNNQIVLN